MTKLPYNYNKKLGYYKVGNQEFTSRSMALLESSRVPHSPYVEFDFNNEFFSNVKWREEPAESLTELYAQRARQLREKYDYIIIAFTGGSDSWTMLNAFLSSNLRVDEIVHFAPIEATSRQKLDVEDYSPTNIATELHFTTNPQLIEISQKYPEIKISIHDWSKNGDKAKLDDDWILSRSVNLTPQINRRWRLEDKLVSVHKHKNIGYIQGLEKPRICIKDMKYYIYFLDFIHIQTLDMEDYANPVWTTEFFYWAPESEKILRKQAHTIKHFFESNSNFKPYIRWPIANSDYRTFYENLIKGIIYPYYDLSWFQVKKPKSLLTFGLETVISPVNPDLHKDWVGGVNDLMSVIDSRYKNKDNDIVGFVSGFYEI